MRATKSRARFGTAAFAQTAPSSRRHCASHRTACSPWEPIHDPLPRLPDGAALPAQRLHPPGAAQPGAQAAVPGGGGGLSEGGEVISLTIHGEAASKANSRKIVTIAGRPSSIKSAKARAFEADALRQIPPACRQQLAGPVRVTLRMFYATERPDLDESLVLDILQDRWAKSKLDGKRVLVQAGVYQNDRQVREKHVYHAIDRRAPRVEIVVEPVQEGLL
ncbi:MAG: RusA family crossover junction endodeoxyribonuclease [Comamonadaceae bacterium]|nr:MAG: RusA family crossover junction endodeoxyribonuclease [Comamonadaceae bacterium]